MLEATSEVLAAARRAGWFTGTLTAGAEHAGELLARGVGVVCLGSDKGFVGSGAQAAYAELTALARSARS